MSKKPWEEYTSPNQVQPQDTVVTEEKKPWEEFAQEGAIPLKKKDESVVEGPGTNASLRPAKPSEKSTESSSNLSKIQKFAQIEFNDYADKRHKELKAEYETNPTPENLQRVNQQYDTDLSAKEKEQNDLVVKFGGLYQKRDKHKAKQEAALKNKPSIIGALARASGVPGIAPIVDILEYTGRSALGTLKDQIPAELRSEDLRVSGGNMEDMLMPRSNFGASGFKSEVITPELQAEFRKWNNKEAKGATVKENIQTFLKNKFGEKYSQKEEEFKAEQGKYRKDIEKEIQSQNEEYAEIIKDAPQDITDVTTDNIGKFIGNLAGQGFGRIIPSLLTAGGSSIIAERSAVFNEQLDKASEATGLSREEIISKGLDDPEAGRLLADFLALTDIASVGNIAAGTGKKLLRKALGIAGEGVQETIQGEGEAYAGAKGAEEAYIRHPMGDLGKPEYEFKPSRAITGGLGGIIGSGAVSALLPGESAQNVAKKATEQNQAILNIQRDIDPNNPASLDQAAAAVEQEVNKPQANEKIKVEPINPDQGFVLRENKEQEGDQVQKQNEEPKQEAQGVVGNSQNLLTSESKPKSEEEIQAMEPDMTTGKYVKKDGSWYLVNKDGAQEKVIDFNRPVSESKGNENAEVVELKTIKEELEKDHAKKRVIDQPERNRIKDLPRNDIRSRVRGYFLDGGKIRWKGILKGDRKIAGAAAEIGGKEGERRSLMGIQDEKKGLSPEEIADKLWNEHSEDERFTDADYRDAVNDLLLSEDRIDWFANQRDQEDNDSGFEKKRRENELNEIDSRITELENQEKGIEQQTKEQYENERRVYGGKEAGRGGISQEATGQEFTEPTALIQQNGDKAKSESATAEIGGLNLTHVPGLGMGQNQAKGTYLSTEKEGNRYATEEKKPVKAKVKIKNPFVTNGDVFAGIQRSAIKQRFDKNSIDDLTEAEVDLLAEFMTDFFINEGYDSIYFPESETQEGELIVFDKKNVEFEKEENNDLKAILKPSIPEFNFISDKAIINTDNPVSNRKDQIELRKRAKALESLIKCIW